MSIRQSRPLRMTTADILNAQFWLDKGVAASAAGLHVEALSALSYAVTLDTQLWEAHLALGLHLMALRRFSDAVSPLKIAASSERASADWHACFAQCLSLTGDFPGSSLAFRRAAEFEPLSANARATYVQAQCLSTIIAGAAEEAFHQFQRETACDLGALRTFAEHAMTLLAGFGHLDAAIAAGEWRLQQTPNDSIVGYKVAALRGASLDRPPQDYVVKYFDAFADRFDHQLVDNLKYRVPADLVSLLSPFRSKFDSILDIGCGTGLAIQHLRSMAPLVVGVDLSSAMLARAAERGGYDELHQFDALAYLQASSSRFDLLFAADLLIYFGQLRDLFEAAARALKPGAFFAFSTERTDRDWCLLPSARFAHSEAYIDHLLHGTFALEAREVAQLRQEGQGAIEGTLHVFRRL